MNWASRDEAADVAEYDGSVAVRALGGGVVTSGTPPVEIEARTGAEVEWAAARAWAPG